MNDLESAEGPATLDRGDLSSRKRLTPEDYVEMALDAGRPVRVDGFLCKCALDRFAPPLVPGCRSRKNLLLVEDGVYRGVHMPAHPTIVKDRVLRALNRVHPLQFSSGHAIGKTLDLRREPFQL